MRRVTVIVVDRQTGALRVKALADIAVDATDRVRGYRQASTVPPGTGLLFVFPHSDRWPFWMKDTAVVLDVIFVDEDSYVVDVKALKPLDEAPVYPPVPVRYALEVPGGSAVGKVRAGNVMKVVG